MPIRMLRDWTRSKKMLLVSVHGERFFTRLIMKVDDYGCYDAEPALLKADLFPYLLNSIRETDLLRWMAECQKAALIVVYENGGKKYLQIIDFRQRLDKSRSKYPLPKPTDFPEVVNDFPAETELENETEQKPKIVGPAGPPPAEIISEKRKNFIPPAQQDAENYFLTTIGNQKNSGAWPADKCKNQGAKFFDHYTANGWKQGGGKKIVDWKAAARLWIRNELEGKFAAPTKSTPAAGSASGRTIPPPALSKEQQEINYLYDRYLDNQCTVVSVEVAHYGCLYRAGLMNLTEDDKQYCRKIAREHLIQKNLFTGDNHSDNALLEPAAKKFAVLHVFRQLQVAEKTEVFTKPNVS